MLKYCPLTDKSVHCHSGSLEIQFPVLGFKWLEKLYNKRVSFTQCVFRGFYILNLWNIYQV